MALILVYLSHFITNSHRTYTQKGSSPVASAAETSIILPKTQIFVNETF